MLTPMCLCCCRCYATIDVYCDALAGPCFGPLIEDSCLDGIKVAVLFIPAGAVGFDGCYCCVAAVARFCAAARSLAASEERALAIRLDLGAPPAPTAVDVPFNGAPTWFALPLYTCCDCFFPGVALRF